MKKENVLTLDSAIYLHFSNNLLNVKLCMEVDFLYICMNKIFIFEMYGLKEKYFCLEFVQTRICWKS